MKKCTICNNDTLVIDNKKREKIYYRCRVCDYIFLDEKFYVDIDEEKRHYDKHDNNFDSLGYVKMFEKLIDEFIRPYIENIKSAFDFGCGEGEVLPILLERNGIVCDRYDYYYFPKKVYVDKKYDLIVSTEVFEHLSDPLNVLKELLLHLDNGGYLLLMTALHPDDDNAFLEWWYIRDITHIGFFSEKTFSFLAKKFDLEIIKHNFKNITLFQKKVG